MKILAFAGSNSRNSINKKLVEYAVSLLPNYEIELVDIHDYEMPIFSVDRFEVNGVPDLGYKFAGKIDQADTLIISLAEHNGAYSAAFKNLFDWVSFISNRTVFNDKAVFLMATSPGPRGGKTVLEIAEKRFPFNGGKVVGTFSLPKFEENFKDGKIVNEELNNELMEKLKILDV